MTARRDHSGWSMVRYPTAADSIGGCDPSWARGPDDWPEPDPIRITDLPDISTYQEQL